MEVSTEVEIIQPKEEEEEEEVIEITEDKEDPLDNLSEDELRAEAKKLRAIASRRERKEKSIVDTTKPNTPFITRDEFYATNRTKAIEILTTVNESDPLADIKKDLNENWSDIMTYYVARNGQETTEKILEDVYDAHLVWKRRQPASSDDSARLLQATVVAQPTGGRTVVKKEAPDTGGLNFNTGTAVDSWYPKKD